MSTGARQPKPTSGPAPVAPQNPDRTVCRSLKPGEIGADRMNPVREERASAAAQIQRSLKAWRTASGPAGKANIPQGGGSALPAEVRGRMEPKLGANLSSVRVHTGSDSAKSAGQLGARAYTVGEDVHFNQGEFAPGTKEGDRLLAHELTHVVQGQKSGVQRKADEGDEQEGQEGTEVSDPAEPAEKEADAVGDQVADDLHGEDSGGENQAKDAKTAKKDTEQKKKEGNEKKEKQQAGGDKKGGEDEGGETQAEGGAEKGAGGDKTEAKGDADGDKGNQTDAAQTAGGEEKAGGEQESEEKPAQVAAKLEGVGFKLYRAGPNPNPNPAVDPAKQAQIDKAKACATPADVDAFCAADPIAVQKLSDVKAETNIENGGSAGAKNGFYTAAAGWIQSNAETLNPATIFNQCFNNLAGQWKFKGTKIDPGAIGNAMQRTQGLKGFWYNVVDQTEYLRQANGAPDEAALAYSLWKQDAAAGNPLKKSNGKEISPEGGTWFTPDSYKLTNASDAGFSELLELAALQPEWFPEGNIVFEVDVAQAKGSMEARKPTAYDGMQSALWVSRPTGDTFGVTGGGANEFLAGKVPTSAVRNPRAVIPSASTQAELQAAITAARDAALAADPVLKARIDAETNDKAKKKLQDMIPNLTDQFLRGTAPAPLSAMVRQMLNEIKSSTEGERGSPSAARAPGEITAPSTH